MCAKFRAFRKWLQESFWCKLNIHLVPRKMAFESQGAVFQGGICSGCDVLKQGKFLGNVWTEEKEVNGIIALSGYNIAPMEAQGYTVIPIP